VLGVRAFAFVRAARRLPLARSCTAADVDTRARRQVLDVDKTDGAGNVKGDVLVRHARKAGTPPTQPLNRGWQPHPCLVLRRRARWSAACRTWWRRAAARWSGRSTASARSRRAGSTPVLTFPDACADNNTHYVARRARSLSSRSWRRRRWR
jgi:hypothetical protein